MKSRSNARGKALESGEKLKGQGNSNAYQILPDFCSPREGRGQRPLDPAVTHEPATMSDLGSSAPTTGCYSKRQLAAYLGLSERTLSRLAARGDLPPADLTIGKSQRWTRETVAKWLKSRPKLRGGRS